MTNYLVSRSLSGVLQSGGKPIVLMGGGTTKVGDPTDKEKSRPLLTDEQIAILISHRFSTVRMADKIAVLADGKILEYGTHHELMEFDGKYAHLFNLQAAGYRD